MSAMLPELFSAVTALEARVKRKAGPPSPGLLLTHQQMRLLGSLDAAGGRRRMRDLAPLLGIGRATLSINAKRLVKGGYILKTRDPRDDRGVFLELAPKARRAFAGHRKGLLGFFEAVLAELPREKQRRLVDAHRFIIETYKELAV